MTHAVPEHYLEQLEFRLVREMGLHFPRSRWRELQRGVDHAAAEFGFANTLDCVQWLLKSTLTREHIEILSAHLTIAETYFFRDKPLFQALENVLLPRLIEMCRSTGTLRIRIWCAGCCTGEEAYSVAILLLRLLPDIASWNISLLATDISPRSLAKARDGSYGTWSFRENKQWMESRYFRNGGTGRISVAPEVRSIVEFAYLNLAEDSYPSLLNNTNATDLIFCRNVLMYFEPDAARDAARKLAASLAEEGILVVAPSELSLASGAQLSPIYLDGTIVHQKRVPAAKALNTAPLSAGRPAVRQESVRQTRQAPARPQPLTHSTGAALQRPRDDAGPSGPILDRVKSLLDRGCFEEAESQAEGHIVSHPGDGEFMRVMTRWYANAGRLDTALCWCDRAIAAESANVCGHYLRALVMRERGDDDAAYAALRRAVYIDPGFVLAHFSMGTLARARGGPGESQKHWRNTVQLLSQCDPETIVPESGGMTAARLREIAQAFLKMEHAS